MSRVGVIGAGYVGLTTAAGLAHLGHDVTCADVDVEKLAALSRGQIPILEEGLPELVAEGLHSGRLSFVLGAGAAARGAEFVFLCVPTPEEEDGSADLSCVEAAVAEIAPNLEPGAVVVAKSTMPPGSSRLVAQLLERTGAPARGIGVASNPEFLREGTAVFDFLHPDRIVIGCDETEVAVRVSALYRGVQAPVIVTDCASAEMIKYASNAFLATKVSFVNAIATLCEAFDADVREVTLGMGYDPRIGFDFLRPGPGYGGSCLPKDTAALIRAAEAAGYDFSLLRGVAEVNAVQVERIVGKVRSAAAASGRDLLGTRVGVLGLTFKANTDDLRDSPALAVVARLLEEGAVVAAYDPAAGERAPAALAARLPDRREIVLAEAPVLAGSRPDPDVEAPPEPHPGVASPRLSIAADPYDACREAAVVAVLTEWDEFRWLDFDRVKVLMAAPAVVDARNLLDPAALRRRGFHYQGVGR